MEGVTRQRILELKGRLNMNIVEKGKEEDPVVVLIHGFPETSYSWRHQMSGIAQRGYHVVAPDLRGFGETDVPEGVHNYTIMHVVGDLVSLIDALGKEKVFVVGHDWGAVMAWGLALFRPEKVKALVNLSVPYNQRHPFFKPIAALKAAYGKNYYIVKYQEIEVAENEFARVGSRTIVRNLITGPNPDPPILREEYPFGGNPLEKEHSLPPWITEQDIDHYATKFEKTGFTGGLNYYRCLDMNWELMAPWQEDKIRVPTKFIIGDEDLVYNMPGNKDYIHNGEFKRLVPFLQDVIIMKGVGHFINQEKPEEITNHICQFIANF